MLRLGWGRGLVSCHNHQGGSQDWEHRPGPRATGMDSSPGSAPNSLWAPGHDKTVLWTSHFSILQRAWWEEKTPKGPLRGSVFWSKMLRLEYSQDQINTQSLFKVKPLLFNPPSRSPTGQDAEFLWPGNEADDISDNGGQYLLSTRSVPRAHSLTPRPDGRPEGWVLYSQPHL